MWLSLRVIQLRSKYEGLLLAQRKLYDLLNCGVSRRVLNPFDNHSPRDFRRASLCASISCRSFSLTAACCSSSVRRATRAGDLDGD